MSRCWRRPHKEVLIDPAVMDRFPAAEGADSDPENEARPKTRERQMRLVRRAMKKMSAREARLIELYFLDQTQHSFRTLAGLAGDGNPGTMHREMRVAIRNLKNIIKGNL